MASLIMQVLDSSFTATRTVTDTTALAQTVSSAVRVAVDTSGNARLITYSYSNPDSSQAGPAPTNEQFVPIATVYSCTTAATTFTKLGQFVSVKEASQPFYLANSGRFYVNLVSFRGGTSLANVSTFNAGASSFLVDITAAVNVATPAKFRVSAVLGEYVPDSSYIHSNDQTGAYAGNTSPAHRPPALNYVTGVGYGQIGLYGLRNYSIGLLTLYEQASTSFAKGAYSGGVVGRYDGLGPVESGYVQSPVIFAVDQKGGSLAAGTYVYTAVWSRIDKEGKQHFSRCAEPITVVQSGGSGNIRVQVSVPTASSYTGVDSIMLFRTATGGTQFYLVETRGVSTSAGTTSTGPVTECMESFTDTLADATLITRSLLYRAPGTDSTALDRCSAVSGRHIVRHKDRVFYCHENTVYYSSFDVDGEAPWFSPGLSFEVIGGAGIITGLASMDGVLVVFKRDSVFVVDGDGPPENGGSGNEFSPPRKLQAEYGCIDPRSICSIPDGIVYRSQLGIMLLNRGLKVVFIGERVQNTVSSYDYVGGSCYDRTNGRLYMVLSDTLTSDGGHDHTAAGVTVVFDTINNVWTKFFHTNTSAYGKGMQDVAFAQSTYSVDGDAVYFVDHNNGSWYEEAGRGEDGADQWVPWKLATGWIRGQSKQDRVRISDLQLLGRWLTYHNIKGEYYANWNRDTATTIKTFNATETALTPEQLEFQPSKENVQSMKFVLTSETPTSPATIGAGTQCEINGITVRIGSKTGGVKLATTAKG